MSGKAELLDRITVRADRLRGKADSPEHADSRGACARDAGGGDTAETILREYPELEPEDIRACLRFAHRSMAGEHVYDRLRFETLRDVP